MKMYNKAMTANNRFMEELYTRTPFIDKQVADKFFSLAYDCCKNIELFWKIKDKLCKCTYQNDLQYKQYINSLDSLLQKQRDLNNFIYTYIKWQKACLRNGTDIRDVEIAQFPNIEDYFQNLM